MTTTKIRKTAWNTYATYCFTHDVANDQASAGGIHVHEVRKTKAGWQKRICQINGRHTSYGTVSQVSDADGEAAFATARTRTS